jgi:hypothetical protein
MIVAISWETGTLHQREEFGGCDVILSVWRLKVANFFAFCRIGNITHITVANDGPLVLSDFITSCMLMSVELQMHDEMFHISSDSVPHSVSTCEFVQERRMYSQNLVCVCEREGGGVGDEVCLWIIHIKVYIHTYIHGNPPCILIPFFCAVLQFHFHPCNLRHTRQCMYKVLSILSSRRDFHRLQSVHLPPPKYFLSSSTHAGIRKPFTKYSRCGSLCNLSLARVPHPI